MFMFNLAVYLNINSGMISTGLSRFA